MRDKPNTRGKENVIYERIYEIVSYEDSENLNTDVIHKFILNKFPDAEYAYALHDKDVNDDGSAKKAHTHHLIRFDREKSINVVARELGIQPSQINWKANWEYSVQYLIHKNAPDKYQYDKSFIHGNCDIDIILQTRFDRKEAHEEAERKELSAIVDYIAMHDGIITMFMLYKFCIDNGIWSSYRRNYSIIKDMLFEGREWRKHGKVTYWYETL